MLAQDFRVALLPLLAKNDLGENIDFLDGCLKRNFLAFL